MGRRAIAATAAVLVLTAACGTKTEHIETGNIVISQPTSKDGDPALAGHAVSQFGADLFGAVRGDTNAVISPASVAIAFAMLEPGATGDGKSQLDAALHVEDPAAFHASMTALRRSLESAHPPKPSGSGDPGDLEIAIANATYMQQGYAIKQSYLDALGAYYGPVLSTVDFRGHGDDAVADINKFIADGTRGHIKKVLERVDSATVLALVNALYLKASWQSPFAASDTKPETFTRLNGSTVTTPLMHGRSDTSTSGDGWVAARKYYSARLAADFVLPDAGRFDQVAGQLATVFPQLGDDPAAGSTLVAPKLETRFLKELRPAIEKLGVHALYDGGNLLGVADDDTLALDQALHATWLVMDEKGTEAAAATVLTATATAGRVEVKAPVPVVLDRPYFFRIVDLETGATLFIGQILDPAAG